MGGASLESEQHAQAARRASDETQVKSECRAQAEPMATSDSDSGSAAAENNARSDSEQPLSENATHSPLSTACYAGDQQLKVSARFGDDCESVVWQGHDYGGGVATTKRETAHRK